MNNKIAITIRVNADLLELFDTEVRLSPAHDDRNSLLATVLVDRYGINLNPAAPGWGEQIRAALERARGSLKGRRS